MSHTSSNICDGGEEMMMRTKDTTINIRTTTHIQSIIDRAASILGQTRTDFILQSVYSRARDVILDQNLFFLDDKGFQSFIDLLDSPPKPNKDLRNLLLKDLEY